MSIIQNLLQKAKKLPSSPGCYLMKDEANNILYVGKAKKLKSRVSTYFNNTDQTLKTKYLVSHIRDFDFLLCASEVEALVLENNLIKKYRPKYNIRLRDDKNYPYLIIDLNVDFPRLEIKRKRIKRSHNILIYGPFVVGSRVGKVLDFLSKAFGIRDCSISEFKSRKRPCLLYQMGHCSAPCVSYISKKKYNEQLQKVIDIFEGRGQKTLTYVESEMYLKSEEEKFEQAALWRDLFFELKNFIEVSYQTAADLKQENKNLDIISYYQGNDDVDICIYIIRKGLLLGHKNFFFSLENCLYSVEEEIVSYLIQYYIEMKGEYPDSLISSLSNDLTQQLRTSLVYHLSHKKIQISSQKDPALDQLLITATQRAQEEQKIRNGHELASSKGLESLKKILGMEYRPQVIECYDIAVWQGQAPTASQVVFTNGHPDKELYRYYHLEVRDEGNNDFRMMEEVIERRVKKGNLPDAFLIDGGKGQVSVVAAILKKNNINKPILGIAKKKSRLGKIIVDERLFINDKKEPIKLENNRALYKLLTWIRDEAHRFSRVLHHKQQNKESLSSFFDGLPEIDSQIKRMILEKIGQFKGNEQREFINWLENLGLKPNVTKKIVKRLESY